MTTLVTGATGFVGSHVARLLVNQGHEVRIFSRQDSSNRGHPRRLAGRTRRGRSARRSFDRTRDARCPPRLSRRRGLPALVRSPEEIYESNVEGTRKLLDAAQRAGVERIVYTSTVATIAVPRHGALPNEETQSELGEMIGHYKRSKFMAEQEAIRAAR